MATRAVAMTVVYHAWDTSANAPKTGDVANHTLRWVKDGTSSAPANAAAEVDATNAKGLYKLALSATETDCLVGKLGGVSSTANIALFGPILAFDYIPNAAAGAINGLPILGANTASLSFTGLTTNIVGNITGNVSGSVASVTGLTTAAIADKVLGRSLATGADGTRTVQDALRAIRNRTAIAAGTLTVYQEDDTTPAWTGAVTTTAGDPISQIDPA